jgi:murein hydrolase activator
MIFTALDKQISQNSAVIFSLEQDLKKLREEYARMIYFAYKNQSSYDYLMFLFSSIDFNQAYRRMRYMQQYAVYRRRQAENIVKTQTALDQRTVLLEQQKNQKQGLLKDKEAEKIQLDKEREEQNTALSSLKKKEADLSSVIKKKQAEARKLANAIEDMIRKEIEATNKKAGVKPSGVYSMTPEEKLISAGFEGNKGKLPWPVERGLVTSSYGEHAHRALSNIKVYNYGIDISTTQGATARAIFGGKVSGVITILGNKAVIIRHGEYLTVYSNLSTVFVNKGDDVKTKQSIGSILTVDNATELHFEVRKGSETMNPEFWLTPK